ncbi:SDR family NAD(P)-dependent oxidoreductase [Amorphus sp. MBR-141]
MYRHPSLNGRVVLVTGASRGLGREMALELAEDGATVALAGSRDSQALRDTAAEAAALADGGETLTVTGDVGDPGACRAMVDQVLGALGRIDVLVNNAGLGMRVISERFNVEPTRFWEIEPTKWRAIVDANVNGTFYMAAAVAPGMIERGFGKIINVSTSDQTMVRKGYAPYGPSKAAIEAASRCWAQDLDGTGVDVNVYLPGGAADTDLLPPSADKKGADGNLLPAAIMRRGVGWLASDASNGITGARFIARLWDETLAPAEAAAGARSPHVDKPAIM